MFNKKRLKNKAMWTSLVAQGLLVVQIGAKLFFDYTLTEDLSLTIVAFADSVLVVLSTLGIVSNPTKPDSDGYNL